MYYKSSKTVMQFDVIHLKIKKDYVYMLETRTNNISASKCMGLESTILTHRTQSGTRYMHGRRLERTAHHTTVMGHR
jgi:hypothetical protein